jgi:hypothetical protein
MSSVFVEASAIYLMYIYVHTYVVLHMCTSYLHSHFRRVRVRSRLQSQKLDNKVLYLSINVDILMYRVISGYDARLSAFNQLVDVDGLDFIVSVNQSRTHKSNSKVTLNLFVSVDVNTENKTH